MKGNKSAWAEMCGAVIGAGFASGREIASFFAKYGPWSWLGAAAAAGVMGWLCLGLMRSPSPDGMPPAWQGTWLGKVWHGMFTALLISAGSAMLAGGGEVAALLLPLRSARAVGLGASLLLAWLMLRRECAWLGRISQGLILCLVAMMTAGLSLPARRAAALPESGIGALCSGVCYGGFNMALAAPAAAEAARGMTRREQRRCALIMTCVVGGLLCCGNGVLLKHSALQGEQLPFVVLLAPLGRAGYVLAGAGLYLACLTTLTACMQGLKNLWPQGMRICAAGVLLLSLGGMESIVGVVYPLLGGACFVLLGAARCSNGTKI